MKKGIGFMFLFFLLTGCGSKRKILDCTITKNDEEISSTVEMVMNYAEDGKELKSYKKITTVENLNDTMLEEVYNDATSMCEEYKGVEGITCNVTKKKDTISQTIEIVPKLLDDTGRNLTDAADIESLDYDTYKREFEEVGYTCK